MTAAGGAALGGTLADGLIASGWTSVVFWGLVCLAVPVAWGVVINRLFERLSKRKGAGGDAAPPEYHI